MNRRAFLRGLGAGGVATAALGGVRPRSLLAQTGQIGQAAQPALPGAGDAGSLRDPSAVGRSAAPTSRWDSDTRIQAIEQRIACRCGCTLDVYTCRTTDFSCGVSPAMHADVIGLVEGGHSADEIIAAFRETYGERVLMSPVKEGFNWAGYVAPFAALGAGAIVVATLIRRWGHRAAAVAAAAPAVGRAPVVAGVDATPEELARIDAAVRRDDA